MGSWYILFYLKIKEIMLFCRVKALIVQSVLSRKETSGKVNAGKKLYLWREDVEHEKIDERLCADVYDSNFYNRGVDFQRSVSWTILSAGST